MVARQQEPLALLQKELDGGTITSLDEALPQADIVVWVASMPKTIEIDTDNLKKPCLMIDGGYPKNLDEKFQGENIHVLKGGIVEFFNDICWNMMELAQKKGINITALGGFTSIIFENFNLLQHKQIRNTSLEWERFTTGNTHTAWVI